MENGIHLLFRAVFSDSIKNILHLDGGSYGASATLCKINRKIFRQVQTMQKCVMTYFFKWVNFASENELICVVKSSFKTSINQKVITRYVVALDTYSLKSYNGF